MQINRYSNLVQAGSDLRNKGYDKSFKFVKNKGLKCLENNKIYTSEDILVKEYHRFEGNSSPTDTSILFVLECGDNIKGTIISSYGVYYDVDLMEFMTKLKIKPKEVFSTRKN